MREGARKQRKERAGREAQVGALFPTRVRSCRASLATVGGGSTEERGESLPENLERELPPTREPPRPVAPGAENAPNFVEIWEKRRGAKKTC